MTDLTEQQHKKIIYNTVMIVIEDMGIDELTSILLPLQLGAKMHDGLLGYEKVKSLLTARDKTEMHSLTEEMFILVGNRVVNKAYEEMG